MCFDCIQGFTTGNHNVDAYPVRLFLEDDNVNFIVAQSYSKIFGLYGERIGALHVITKFEYFIESIEIIN